ncbi:hypothetical protein Bhyg_05860 [Pseudolycoriella hygida]|uniref:Uncharacterized protein n=1 Tax=Pseudolycoriella hygida TaxID=35572 RepID=A0A9Q0MZI5_9DIPT|nr:hypothetical protein Bhyg_05860 [Pseudolycoriella hygida]
MSVDDDFPLDLDDVPLSYLVERARSNDLCWSSIADKFGALITNFKPSAAVEFLDSLLLHLREGPRGSRTFTERVGQYLLGFKYVVLQEVDADESYFGHLKKVLVAYCISELRLISIIDNESAVASDIFHKITMLMKMRSGGQTDLAFGSTSNNVMDVLIDLIEETQDPRSKSVIKIICSKYLTMNLVVGPTVLDDNEFVKHLILFRLWFEEEIVAEKLKVLRFFLSSIKPSPEFRSNQHYSFLNNYNKDEKGDYKSFIYQALHQSTLIRALRSAKCAGYQNKDENIIDLDLLQDDDMIIEIEDEDIIPLTSQDEVIVIYDDDTDTEISYLPKLFEDLENLKMCERRLERRLPIENEGNDVSTIHAVDLTSDDDVNNVNETFENADVTIEVGANETISYERMRSEESSTLNSYLFEAHDYETNNCDPSRTVSESSSEEPGIRKVDDKIYLNKSDIMWQSRQIFS